MYEKEQIEGIVKKYCDLRNYIEELDKDLHSYMRPHSRTLEQVAYDLERLIK